MARIAVFDDNHLARKSLAGMLRVLGHQYFEYDPNSLFDSLKDLREEMPDLVMVDLNMPKCPGMSLVRAIREDPVLSVLPVVVVSSPSEQGVVETLVGLGILGFVTKPLDAGEVERHVSEALQCRLPDRGRTARVAVIHPNPETLLRIQQSLAPAGYQVIGLVPTSLVEALGMLVADPPDLILLSLSLTAFPSISLIRAVREDHRLQDLPLILQAGDEDEAPAELLDTFKVDSVMRLPLQAALLQGQVRKALERKEGRAMA